MTKSAKYKFSQHSDNVYGHATSLLEKHVPAAGVHLDFGCGYAAIASSVQAMGLTYLGFDIDTDSLADVRSRGFEAAVLDLNAVDTLLARVHSALAGRVVASVSILDVLEHVLSAPKVLAKLREIAAPSCAPLIVSVPNVAHRDLAFALLTGRWQYTQTGLLDHTHTFMFNDASLSAVARSTGWRQVDQYDVALERSDQHSSPAHTALSEHTWLGMFLRTVRDSADEFGSVNQLVRAFLPGPVRADLEPFPDFVKETRPFLSVVTRTQGRRPGALRDVLLALSAQTVQDFEVIVLPHKTAPEQQRVIERLVEDVPASLRARIRIEKVDNGGRTSPLNVGFELARGEYIAILDDDDLIFANWVEEYRSLARRAPGTVLRTVAVEQCVEATSSDSAPGFVVAGPAETTFPSEYDYFRHLTMNESPPVCLAFPRSAFHDFGVRFDEALDTVEDWDYELRAIALCGITYSRTVTAIYHRWRTGESSYTVHPPEHWKRDFYRVIERFDSQPRIFPPGTVAHIRAQAETIERLRGELEALQTVEAEPPSFVRLRKFGARWRRRTLSFGRKLAKKLRPAR